jgi:hypothetical protein
LVLYGEFDFDQEEREAFRTGELPTRWRSDYPGLFDEDDARLAATQPTGHYFEWLAAIRIYEDLGYLSLVEKYQFRRHRRKYEIFQALVPKEAVTLLASRFLGARQAPDLLCYAPDKADWFFCEVKGGHDRMRDTQSTTFALLERMTSKQVRLITFKEVRKAGATQATPDGA